MKKISVILVVLLSVLSFNKVVCQDIQNNKEKLVVFYYKGVKYVGVQEEYLVDKKKVKSPDDFSDCEQVKVTPDDSIALLLNQVNLDFQRDYSNLQDKYNDLKRKHEILQDGYTLACTRYDRMKREFTDYIYKNKLEDK